MKFIKKNWIKVNDNTEDQVEITEETKEDEKMGFFQKHKKGLIIGGLGALAAGAVGLILAKSSSDDDYEDDYDLDDEDEAEETGSDEADA